MFCLGKQDLKHLCHKNRKERSGTSLRDRRKKCSEGFIMYCEIKVKTNLDEEYIYIYIQVHLNKLECRGKVNLFQ